jgi:hypothetical protein
MEARLVQARSSAHSKALEAALSASTMLVLRGGKGDDLYSPCQLERPEAAAYADSQFTNHVSGSSFRTEIIPLFV